MSLISIICSLASLMMTIQEGLTFSGIVTTSGGRAVEGATVLMQNGDQSLIKTAGTNELGKFEFTGLPEGQYHLWIARDGYDIHSDTIQLGQAENTLDLRFNLLENNQRLAEIVSMRDQSNFEIAGTELRKGRVDRALSIYTSFLSKYPYLVKVHYNIGLCYMEKADKARVQNKRDEYYLNEHYAQSHFLIVLSRYPDLYGPRKALADSYICAQMVKEATEEYRLLLQKVRNDATLWFTFGELNSYLRRFDIAESAFQKVLDVDPAMVDAHAKIGAVLMVKGDLEGAIASYKTFLRLAPDSDMAKLTRELMEECQDKLEERQKSQQKEKDSP